MGMPVQRLFRSRCVGDMRGEGGGLGAVMMMMMTMFERCIDVHRGDTSGGHMVSRYIYSLRKLLPSFVGTALGLYGGGAMFDSTTWRWV